MRGLSQSNFLTTILFAMLQVINALIVSDCVDPRFEITCVIPSSCTESQKIQKNCPGGKVCCRNRVKRKSAKSSVPKPKYLPLSQKWPSHYIFFPDEWPDVKNALLRLEPVEDKVAKSARHCQEYKKFTTQYSYAMPLLPNIAPIKINMEVCKPRFKPLIVGGVNATVAEFPHMAAVGFARRNIVEFLCGGTIISEYFIMTAAHCTTTKWGPPVIVRVGTATPYSRVGISAAISQVFPHPSYVSTSSYNDIGLLRLDRKLKFNLFMRPACLPTASTMTHAGQRLVATGWGKTGFGRESSQDLQKVPLEVVDNESCNEYYWSNKGTKQLLKGITSTMICAKGYENAIQDTCRGDSGGPLQSRLPGTDCMTQVLGVTAFGKTCGSGIPGVYTDVASFVPWIESIVWP